MKISACRSCNSTNLKPVFQMMLKTRFLTCFSLLIFVVSFGQMQNYSYKRELIGVKDTWHKLTLPNEIFEKVSAFFIDNIL